MNNIQLFSSHCCGCGLCASVCNHKAITMQINSDGFAFPNVDSSKCTDCGMCVKACAYNRQEHQLSEPLQFELVQHKDEAIRASSRSGGAFTALSDEILRRRGAVYGCKLESPYEAKHARATVPVERDAFRGSKYIQSDITECYSQIKKDLLEQKWVLFSGTPCQVEAVKVFCGNIDTSRLVLADIVCYGVPGCSVWRDYLKLVSSCYGKPVKQVDFRDKTRFGWAHHAESIILERGEEYHGQIYARLFNSKLILRDACFSCPYKSLHRAGDVTLADAWGIDNTYRALNDDKGTSLLLINSEKGNALFEQVSGALNHVQLPTIGGFLQPCMKENWPMPDNYAAFWEDYHRMDFDSLLKKYLSTTVHDTVAAQKRSVSRTLRQTAKGVLRRIEQRRQTRLAASAPRRSFLLEPGLAGQASTGPNGVRPMHFAIVTFIRAYNYGATLQAYALQKKFLDLGLAVDVLDYAPKYFQNLYWAKFIAYKMRRRPYRPLRKWVKYQYVKRALRYRNEKYERFILNTICLSEKQYHCQKDLDHVAAYDGYIVGSDQVWCAGLTDFDPVFFLDWAHPKEPMRFSYAASFGEGEIPDELKEQYRKLLSGWDAHSVREHSGAVLLHSLTGEEVVQCCDPSLLLSRKEWDEIAAKKIAFRKPYIMVYYVNNIHNVVEYAKELRDQTGLEVLLFTSITQEEQLLGTVGKSCGFRHMMMAAPDDFLSYIHNAEYVISDSFHCAVISILYHKRFFIAPNRKTNTLNARVADLLRCLGIIWKPEISSIDEPIAWDQVDHALAEYRSQSVEYLKGIVNTIKKRQEG